MAATFLGLPTGRLKGRGEGPPLPALAVRDLDERLTPPLARLGRLTPSRAQAIERYRVHEGDVVLTCRGTQFKVARVGRATTGALATANLIVVRPGPALLPALLYNILCSAPTQAALLRRSRSSTVHFALAPRDVASLPVPVPPLAVQQKLARLVELAEEHHRLAQAAAALSQRLAAQVAAELLQGAAEAPRLDEEGASS